MEPVLTQPGLGVTTTTITTITQTGGDWSSGLFDVCGDKTTCNFNTTSLLQICLFAFWENSDVVDGFPSAFILFRVMRKATWLVKKRTMQSQRIKKLLQECQKLKQLLGFFMFFPKCIFFKFLGSDKHFKRMPPEKSSANYSHTNFASLLLCLQVFWGHWCRVVWTWVWLSTTGSVCACLSYQDPRSPCGSGSGSGTRYGWVLKK